MSILNEMKNKDNQATIQIFIIWIASLVGALILNCPTVFLAPVIATFIVCLLEFILRVVSDDLKNN